MRTFLVSAVLLFFLFLGIFIGIQYAESGIREVQGTDVPLQDEAVAAQGEGEPVDLSLLGKTFSQQGGEMAGTESAGENESAAEIGDALTSGNIYADLGTLIGTWIQEGVRGLADLVLGLLDGLM